jgi:hypothetical protein
MKVGIQLATRCYTDLLLHGSSPSFRQQQSASKLLAPQGQAFTISALCQL